MQYRSIPPSFYGFDAQVAVLIDMERSCWIDEAIDNNFLAHDAEAIKLIPLCFSNTND